MALPPGSVATNAAGWDNAIEARVSREAIGDVQAVAAAAGLADPGADQLKDLGPRGQPRERRLPHRRAGPRLVGQAPGARAASRGRSTRSSSTSICGRLTVGRERALDARARLPRADLPLERERSRRSGAARASSSTTASTCRPTYEAGHREPAPVLAALARRVARTPAPRSRRASSTTSARTCGTIVVSPRGRGTSRWYVGKGHVDFREVWRDVHRRFTVDPDRTYVAGHSMGGWGSFLLTILYPDRFAAALPASPPVTQGMWTGLDFAGCDDYEAGGYTPCYGGANDGDARVQHTRRLLENVRHVPWAIYHGAADELVPVSGVTRQVERLVQLGYRHRYYLFPAQEHYGPPITDEWSEGAQYLHRFARPQNPSRVTYIRDMPFERATETIQSDEVPLSFSFDRAYWMSRLEPADPEAGVASFDGTSAAIPEEPYTAVPEAGGPAAIGQTGPFVMTGMQWLTGLAGDAPEPANGFTATLTGARGVRLNLERMAIDVTKPVTATIETDKPLTLELRADWGPGEGRVRTFELPAGKNELAARASRPARARRRAPRRPRPACRSRAAGACGRRPCRRPRRRSRRTSCSRRGRSPGRSRCSTTSTPT